MNLKEELTVFNRYFEQVNGHISQMSMLIVFFERLQECDEGANTKMIVDFLQDQLNYMMK